jgi:hypothetical protein
MLNIISTSGGAWVYDGSAVYPVAGETTPFKAGQFINSETKSESEYGSNQYEDPGFEDWEDDVSLVNWSDFYFGYGLGDAGIERNTTTYRSGSSAVDIYSSGGDFGVVYQMVESTDQLAKYSIYARLKEGTPNLAVIAFDGDPDADPGDPERAEKVFDKVNWEWIEWVSGPPTEDAIFSHGLNSEDWTLCTNEDIPMPESGRISFAYITGGETGGRITVDDAENQFKSSTSINGFELYLTQPLSTLTEYDFIFGILDSMGSYALRFQGNGSITSYYSRLDFKVTKIGVGNADSPGDALNGQTGIALLGTAEDLDLKEVNTLDLYTVPTGYELLAPRVFLKLTEADGIDSFNVGEVTAGSNSTSFDNVSWNPDIRLNGLLAVGQGTYLDQPTALTIKSVIDEEVTIRLNVKTGYTATGNVVGKAYIFGTLIEKSE